MTKIQIAAERLVKQYGSLRKAQQATGINYSYLQRLIKGGRQRPTDEVLAKLGLQRRVDYVRSKVTAVTADL